MKPSNVFSWEILLVEDNSADVFLTQEALKESNISHNLQLAGDGVAALEYLQQEGDNAGAVRPRHHTPGPGYAEDGWPRNCWQGSSQMRV